MRKQLSMLVGVCMTLTSVAHADQLRELVSNEAALGARYHMIKSAKKEILAQYFAVGRDETALTGLALLQEAAKKGVKVKLIVDNMHNELTRADIAALTGVRENPDVAKNFEIKVFNPISSLNPMKQSYRDHSKRLVVDGETMIMGGRNAAGGYFGKSKNASENLLDFEVMVQGKSAQAARTDYLDLWNKNKRVKTPELYEVSKDLVGVGAPCVYAGDSLVCHDRNDDPAVQKITKSQTEITEYLQKLMDQNRNKSLKSMDFFFNNAEDVDVKFISNDPTKNMEDVEDTVADQLFTYLGANAQKTITIATPYLFPTPRALEMMKKLIKEKGIKIKIVTNSLASTDMPIVHAGYQSIQKQLADMGVEVSEYKGPNILHAKVLVMDAGTPNATTMTGSFNFDQRSALINREIGVIITGKDREAVAKKANGVIQRWEADSIPTVQGGKIVNQDQVETLLNRLDPDVAAQKRKDLEDNRSMVKLVPKHI
jgi:putative cardiolipin synthase